jgi:hypothetical protein
MGNEANGQRLLILVGGLRGEGAQIMAKRSLRKKSFPKNKNLILKGLQGKALPTQRGKGALYIQFL